METIVEVILPLAVKSGFTYRCREDQAERAEPGKRVLVSFGKRKIYTGLIRSVNRVGLAESVDRLKYVEEILDEQPLIHPSQIDLWDWISFYYACTPGEVFKAALPMGLKPESALSVKMPEDLAWEQLELDDKEFLLMEALSIQNTLSFKEVSEIWQVINPNPRLKTMAARGLVILAQEVQDTYKPKLKSYLQLPEKMQDEEQLRLAFDSLSRAPSQENLLMRVVADYYQDKTSPKSETLKELGLGSQVAKVLIEKGYLIEEKVQVDRLELYGYKHHPQKITLNQDQERALAEIKQYFGKTPLKPVLLHGVTGSGKTHVYLELIKEQLAQGKQVLYLLPEITLTKQIIDRVKSELGEKVGVYHSRFNDRERVEIWQKVRKGDYDVVIGVRSAIFLPFQKLGLIVVDEEHDQSFKQHEPAPRYNARDVAIYYGFKEKCPVILGSATPAFETYENARQGKHHLVTLEKRAISTQMPQIELVDMRIQRKKKLLQGPFSQVLETAIGEALERGEQVILFQNRRGYAPYLICENCGHVPQCINCDISLTYHKERNHLRCHYCGHTEFNTQKCDNCGHFALRRAGLGTERILEAVAETFPDYTAARMDLDTTRTKMGYQNLINRFESGQIDILVGTQMVSKGLDFENVTLVGVIAADNLLSFPDFRAFEYAYQLLTQVSGRAGRRSKTGRVIIQSYMPDNVVLNAIERPYLDFYKIELPGRQHAGYPPYSRLIRIEIRHPKREFIEPESLRLHRLLKPYFGENLLGPDYALIPRLRNQYRMQFLIKLGKNVSPERIRDILFAQREKYYQEAPVKNLRIIIDVDPV